MDRREFVKRGATLAAGTMAAQTAIAGAAPAPLFKDTFDRKAQNGWGKPWFNQRYGNPWRVAQKKGVYELPELQLGGGRFNPNPVLLLDHDAVAVDFKALISSSNENAPFGLVARAGGYSAYYAAYLEGDSIHLVRFSASKEDEIRVSPAGFTVAAGKSYWMRLSISGTTTVKLNVKVWQAGNKEPKNFTTTALDTTPPKELTIAGPFGFLFLPDVTTARATSFKVSKFTAKSSETATRTRPRVTYAFAGRLEQEPGGTFATKLIAKTAVPGQVVFHVGSNPQLSDFRTVNPDEVFTQPLTSKARLSGLTAGTSVFWRAVVKSKSKGKARTQVHSFPVPAAGQTTSFAFGSCSHLYPLSKSYDIAATVTPAPAFFCHLGDFGYAQDDDGAAMAARADSYQDRWTRMFDRSSVLKLHETSAWIGLQDDHDYGADNSTAQTIKPFTIDAWSQMTANSDANRGYFDARYGDIHAFFLDVHRYSDEQSLEDGPNHTILGDTQKQWLKDTMRSSDAPLIVVFTPMPFWGAGRGIISWKKAFLVEGTELLNFFRDRQTENRRVIVCAGNAHAHYIARHPHPAGGKDIIEFVSSGTDRIDSTTAESLPDDGIIDQGRSVKKVNGFGLVTLSAPSTGPRTVTFRAMASDPVELGRTSVWNPLEVSI